MEVLILWAMAHKKAFAINTSIIKLTLMHVLI